MFIAYIVTVVISFILDIVDRLVRKSSYTDGFSLFMSVVISFTPIINLIFAYISLSEISVYYGKKRKVKLDLLKKYNQFVECDSCKVIVRHAYFIENEGNCPICNHFEFNAIKDGDYIENSSIREQSYISNVEEFKKIKLDKKSKEQEEIYLKALEKKLKNQQ